MRWTTLLLLQSRKNDWNLCMYACVRKIRCKKRVCRTLVKVYAPLIFDIHGVILCRIQYTPTRWRRRRGFSSPSRVGATKNMVVTKGMWPTRRRRSLWGRKDWFSTYRTGACTLQPLLEILCYFFPQSSWGGQRILTLKQSLCSQWEQLLSLRTWSVGWYWKV